MFLESLVLRVLARNDPPSGRFTNGKGVPFLRSKVAVARFLERDGLTAEDLEKMEAAMTESKEKAMAKARAEALLAPKSSLSGMDLDGPTSQENGAGAGAGAGGGGGGFAVREPSTPEPVKPLTRRGVADALVQRLDAMIAQCCYCLYGVELCAIPRKCRDEVGDLLGTASQPPFDPRETGSWTWVNAHRWVGHHEPCSCVCISSHPEDESCSDRR